MKTTMARRIARAVSLFAGLWILIGNAQAQSPTSKDRERIVAIFNSLDAKQIDEQLVQLRWAGITDEGLYLYLIHAIQNQKMAERTREKYVEALGYSGNPTIYAKLEALAADKKLSSGVRSQARNAMKQANRYTEIAAVMNVGVDQATTVAQLWAIRHKNGLAVGESVRMRWAARDIYLHGYGRESLDIAAQFLHDNVADPLTDRYREDGMAFLCKALGLSRVPDYKEPLIYVANNAVSDKLARYAERSAQYFDAGFKATNTARKPQAQAQSRRP